MNMNSPILKWAGIVLAVIALVAGAVGFLDAQRTEIRLQTLAITEVRTTVFQLFDRLDEVEAELRALSSTITTSQDDTRGEVGIIKGWLEVWLPVVRVLVMEAIWDALRIATSRPSSVN